MGRAPIIIVSLALALAVCGTATAASDFERSRAFLNDGRKLLENGKPAAAIIQFRNAVASDPANPEMHFQLGLALALNRGVDPHAAEDELRRAEAAGFDKDQVAVTLAELYLRQERYGELLDAFAEGNRPKEIEARIRTARAYAELNLRRPKDAERSFSEAIALAQAGLAQTRIVMNDLPGAADLLEKALQIEPRLADAWILLGRVRALQNDKLRARNAFDKAIAIAPYNVVALLGRAALTIDDDERQARADIDLLLDQAPDNPRVNLLDAILKARHERWREAQVALMTILAPEYLPQALYLLSRVDLALGQIGQAEANINQYLALVPKDAAGLGVQASVMMRRGKPAGAVEILRRALIDDPNNTDLLGLLSDAYTLNGQKADAAATLDRLSAVAPKDAATRLRIAEQRIAVGRVAEALVDIQIARASEPLSPQATILAVQTLLGAGRVDDAAAVAADLGKRAPDSPVPETLLGVVAMRKGGASEARPHFEKALALQANFVTAAIDLAQTYRMERRFDDGRAVYDRIVKLEPRNTELMIARSDLEFADKKTAEGVAWLERARAADPQSIPAHMQLLRAYLDLKQAAKAVAMARELEQIAPADPQAIAGLAEAQLADNDRQTAITTLQRVVDMTNGAPDALIRLARATELDGKVSAAYGYMRKAWETNPGDARLQAALLDFSVRTDTVGASISFARDLAQLRPDDPAPRDMLGQLYEADRRYDKAIEAFSEAFAKDENSFLVRRLAHAQAAGGQSDAAAATLGKWLAKRQDDADARLGYAIILAEAKQTEPAIAQYEQILAVSPRNPIVLNNLAWLYLQKGDKRALAVAQRAYEAAPESPIIADTLGWILCESGDAASATEILNKAAAGATPPPAARYHFAVALDKTGRHDDARQVLSDLLQSGAKFDESAAAQQLLSRLGG
ncbi:MAG: prsT [Rhodospirillales bacterium]|nr:prsT [Rhodospirillales bacterium]